MQGFDVVLHEYCLIVHVASLIACQLCIWEIIINMHVMMIHEACVWKWFLKICKGLMMPAIDESTEYIRKESFSSEMDFDPRFMIWTSMSWFWTLVPCLWFHISMDECSSIIMWKYFKWYSWLFCLSIPMTLMLAFFQLFLLGLVAHICLRHSK